MTLILSPTPKRDTDYSIWPLAYCQADMPYDFFGGSGMYSNRGTIKIPMIYTLVVGGEVVMDHGTHSGALPGRVIRATRR